MADWSSSIELKSTILVIFAFLITTASCNSPPRFILSHDGEIVLKLKESPETPVGALIFQLRAEDADGDDLTFGLIGPIANSLLRLTKTGRYSADLHLKKELDREIQDSYTIVLTLTDNKLGDGNFITQTMLLLLLDINDNAPIFKPFKSTITIKENSLPGVVETIEAVDRDEGPFGQIVFQLEDSDDTLEKFSIKTENGKGVISLKKSLDYEEKYLYQLRVLAIDHAHIGVTNTATVAILVRVEDQEDQPPEFAIAPPVTRIPENLPLGSVVLKVKAIDGDRGINNGIAYRIIGNSQTPFEIDSSSGEIKVKTTLDRESTVNTNGAYILRIQAQEVTTAVIPPPKVDIEVTIILTDVNDETPLFRSPHYQGEIIENAQVNVPVDFLGSGIPEVFDHDQGKNGTFRLYLAGDNSVFTITPSEVVNDARFLIRVKNPAALDYESVKQMKFKIVAEEMVPIFAKKSAVDVTINIKDANDNIPQFEESESVASIAENSPAGTRVAWVKANDKDSGIYGTQGLRYTRIRGQISDLLDLDPRTGVITLNKNSVDILDREKTSDYYLTVEVRDDDGRGNRNSVQIHLILDDVNDNAPIFVQPKYEARIEENQPAFNNKLIVKATDEDLNGTKNSEVRYKIISGDPDRNFTVNTVTGRIKPVYPLDFERMSKGVGDVHQIQLTVRAYDLGVPSLFTDVPVIIYVKDMNDHAPVFQKSYYSKSIAEDIRGGSSVIRVHAFDADKSEVNRKVAYRIENGALDKFVIDAFTGVISVADRAKLDPDLTVPKTDYYVLDVIAIDGGIGKQQKQTSVTVNITVTDINNKPPQFDDPVTVKVIENAKQGYFVAQMRAHDPDSRSVLRYSIDYDKTEAQSVDGSSVNKAIYNIDGLFEIDPVDGTIRVVRELDREMTEIIRLSVKVEDMASATGEQTATATLIIEVEDVNDNPPKFSKDRYRSAISENAKLGVNILTVIAEDADKNKTISYRLETRGRLQEFLSIEPQTGEIKVRSRIDRESYSWLNFTVVAVDGGIPPRSGFVQVFVQVLDENDNNPTFVDDIRDVAISEDAKVGQEVVTVRATDADVGEYGKITYLLDSKSSQGKFTIDRETGVITVAEELDREKTDAYNLIVQAWDNYQYGFSTGESRNVFKQIFVVVRDVNDEVPYFIKDNSCSIVTEYHNTRDTIAIVKAADKDDSRTGNGQLTFSLSGRDARLFSIAQIDMKTARIVAKTSLVGKFGNYSLTVKASDRGHPQKFSTAEYDVCVVDVNDNAPVFVSPPQNVTVKIPENATIGTSVVKVHAVDSDVGKNGEVHYRIKPLLDNHWKTFQIDEEVGVITLARELDREVQANYKIRVEAYDLGQPTLLSDLDLSIYVTNINDFAPQFLVDTFNVHFKENRLAGAEKRKLVSTVDRDDEDDEAKKIIPCYFIVGGNGLDNFDLDAFTHTVTTSTELDRETKSEYKLIIRATDDCFSTPARITNFDPRDDTLLHLDITVDDVNDNAPRFTKPIFTGGVSTDQDFGTIFMRVKATDPDDDENGRITYHMVGGVKSTLSSNLENLGGRPFAIDRDSGDISLNFDPQRGMKGYFDFLVRANDSHGLSDTSRVFIYLLREDQRVKFILRLNPSELREKLDQFGDVLANITGAIVNVDKYKFHENLDGSVDKTKSDLYLHFVRREDNSIMDVNMVLSLIDKNTEFLVELFKEYNVLDSMPAEAIIIKDEEIGLIKIALIGLCVFLMIMLLLVIAICLAQRSRYERQLKAATATAFGSHDSGLNRVDVPNTNQHSVEGSNPIWMQGYDNEGWVKDDDTMSQASVGNNSLDENVVQTLANGKANGRLVRKRGAAPPPPRVPNLENSSVSDENNDQNHVTTINDSKANSKEQNDLNKTYRNNLIYETSKRVITNPLILKIETSEL